jgi:6,7-dimethyl-8-ribityllumazine synthase
MFGSEKGKAQDDLLDGRKLYIGIVQARFNESVTNTLAAACREELLKLGVVEKHIDHFTVPGALEVPLALTKLAATQDFDALIAVGAVVRGDTYHFEVVSNESAAGISRVALDTGVPVANAILTCDTDEQVRARMTDKGRDAARVAVEMANLLWALEEAGDEELDTAGGAPARDDD